MLAACVKRSLKALCWIPPLIICLGFLWSYYSYVWDFCLMTVTNHSEKAAYLVMISVLFLVLTLSYCKVVLTPPRHPTKRFSLPSCDMKRYDQGSPEVQKEILAQFSSRLPISTTTESGAIRFCDKCRSIKPDRCHHCFICGMCVLKKDHHCPWVNNCIGYSNYKFFILLLVYTVLYCMYISCSVFKYFYLSLTDELPNNTTDQVQFLFAISTVFCLVTMGFLGFHCWLIIVNRTTIEFTWAPIFQNGPDKNGFNLGVRKNLEEVFGEKKKWWLIPVFTSLGNGLSFPVRWFDNVTVTMNTIQAKAGHWDDKLKDVWNPDCEETSVITIKVEK